MISEQVAYDRPTVVLHWITFALVATLWIIAQVIDAFPNGSPRVAVRSLHIVLGMVLAVVLLARLGWRLTGGVRLPLADPGLAGRLAHYVHVLLYLLMAWMIVGGMANVWVRGDSIFGVLQIAAFAPGDRATRRLVGGLHELGANLILLVAGLHAAAALAHHFLLRDGVLRRMWPASGR